MAIFGHLSELPFLEVTRLLRTRRGRLTVQLDGGHTYKLFVQDGVLAELLLDDRPLEHAVAQDLLRLSQASAGRFEFSPLAHPLPHPRLSLALAGLEGWLLAYTPSAEAEAQERRDLERLRDALPHPSTGFMRLEGVSPAATQAWQQFLERHGSFEARLSARFERGVSAEELSVLVGLPLDRAQLALYRLGQAGAVGVLRRVEQAHAPLPEVARKPGLLSRLMGALGLRGVRG